MPDGLYKCTRTPDTGKEMLTHEGLEYWLELMEKDGWRLVCFAPLPYMTIAAIGYANPEYGVPKTDPVWIFRRIGA